MKKILALLLASLLVISLFAGCAKQTKDTMKKRRAARRQRRNGEGKHGRKDG